MGAKERIEARLLKQTAQKQKIKHNFDDMKAAIIIAKEMKLPSLMFMLATYRLFKVLFKDKL